ncbi:ABC transporter substrate-binding protein [Rhizobium sp. A37_96]
MVIRDRSSLGSARQADGGPGNPLTRRRFIAGAAASLAGYPLASKAAAAERKIVSLNWAISETLYALGITPIAAAETASYDLVVGQPRTPAATVDVGLQGAPNFEYIAQLSPDIILIQTWQESLRAPLERCAPVETIGIHTGEGDVYQHACDAVRKIGALTGRAAESEAFLAGVEARFASLRKNVQARSVAPLYLVQMIDDNNLTVFSRGSLFDAALSKLGLINAWQGEPTLLWGGSVVGIEQLAADPKAGIMLIDSPGLAPEEALTKSPLWATLPAVRSGRFTRIPSYWGFGALPTSVRFAETVASSLESLSG